MAKIWMCFLIVHLTYIDPAPVSKRMVDLSYVFDNDTLYPPSQRKFEIVVTMNERDRTYWFQQEEYTSAIHVGTHMDAPSHFIMGGLSVDNIPLERLVAAAAVIDVEEKATANPDYLVTVEDLEAWENETSQTLNDVIVIIHSGWGKRWGDKERFMGTDSNDSTQFHFPGMSPEAAQWLVDERNVYGVGNEAMSLDNGQSLDFRAHRILLKANIFGLENVANVDKLPIYGALLYVMPMKIGNGSGAPTRIVATFPDVIYKSPRKSKALREIIIFS